MARITQNLFLPRTPFKLQQLQQHGIMSRKEKVSVADLLSRLNVFTGSEEHEGVADSAERILKLSPGDLNATKSLAVAWIMLDKYQKVYDLLSSNTAAQQECSLEYAYALYKLAKHDELTAWAAQNPNNRGIRHAYAQSLYKEESFAKALEVYRSLAPAGYVVENEAFDLAVNERAVLAQGNLNQIEFADPTPVSATNPNSYDQLFNTATAYIGQGEYQLALDALKNAKIKCQTSSNLSSQELMSELVPIMVQASYASYKAGNTQESQKILESIDVASLDPTLRYIVNTNKLVIEKLVQPNPNFNLRYIESGSDYNQILTKLVRAQIQIANNNKFTLSLSAGKDPKKLVKSQSKATVPVDKSLQCTTTLNEIKDLAPAEQIHQLSKQFNKTPSVDRLAFTLAQLYTDKKDYNMAAATLTSHVKSIEESDPSTAYSPGYVAALTSLYRVAQKYYNAIDYFEKAVSYWSTFEGKTDVSDLIKEASYALAGFDKNIPEVKAYLESQLAENPNDITVISGILALGDKEITSKHQNLVSKLASVDSLISGVDVDALENLGVSTLLKRPTASGDQYKVTKPKKQTHKPRLPKDYDASKTPDPERWMPKRDRSTWKPKRKEKKNKNITQGGATDESLSVSESKASAASSSVVKNKAKQTNKKKKKGKK